MKWIVLLVLIAASAWVYFNVDFSQLNSNAENTLKQEKTMKVFFDGR